MPSGDDVCIVCRDDNFLGRLDNFSSSLIFMDKKINCRIFLALLLHIILLPYSLLRLKQNQTKLSKNDNLNDYVRYIFHQKVHFVFIIHVSAQYIDMADGYGNTPLVLAAVYGHPTVAEVVLLFIIRTSHGCAVNFFHFFLLENRQFNKY